MNFDGLGLSPNLAKAVTDRGYEQATSIQTESIPLVLDGRDLLAAAPSGTGKTAAFLLPILQRLAFVGVARPKQLRTLVLTPGRGLASQLHESVLAYGRYLNLHSALVFGGVKIEPQIAAIENGVDILVATPRRLLELVQHEAVDFSALEVLALDDVDRMLDMGLLHDIRRIVDRLPRNRQTLMFSAALSDAVKSLGTRCLVDPAKVDVAPAYRRTELREQLACPVDQSRKIGPDFGGKTSTAA